MPIKPKVLVTASLITILSVNSMTYAATPKAVNTRVTYETLFRENFQENRTFQMEKQWDLNKLLMKDLSIKKNLTQPQILIIHAHPHETYKDNEGSVIEVGRALEQELEAYYQVAVLHYEAPKSDKANVIGAYERIEKDVTKILQENPSIEVIIDVHRDGALEPTATYIKGKATAKIHMVNGLSLDESSGEIGGSKTYPNPYIEDNLSFSAQVKYKSDTLAPDLIAHVILEPYRYSLHMAPKSLLINIGNNNDTLEEALEAVHPFTEVLAEVLSLEKKDSGRK